jgi:hypothetical protein
MRTGNDLQTNCCANDRAQYVYDSRSVLWDDSILLLEWENRDLVHDPRIMRMLPKSIDAARRCKRMNGEVGVM